MTYDLPPDMTYKDFRKHPVTQTLQNAAHGHRGLPTPRKLDGLKLPAVARMKLDAECRKVATAYDRGYRKGAWEEAKSAAAGILGDLSPGYHRPDYLTANEPDPTDNMNPAELAALIPRI